ncbi:MAG: hypothetical protein ACI8QT_001139 [Halioglobus sp.]|jgi:hypothetical protein
MATNFTAGSFFARWIFAAVLSFGTYNPSGYSYMGWLSSDTIELGPVPAIIGLVLVIAWIIYLRATFLSMGWLGVCLGAALFGCIVWLFVDLKWLSLDSTSSMGYVALLLLSLILATGMSWSHIRRRLTGQIDVDDVEV